MCLGVCACQLFTGPGKSMDKHKRAGWVGVTGNFDPSCTRPHLKRLQEAVLQQGLQERLLK